jgi:hypothetical protein
MAHLTCRNFTSVEGTFEERLDRLYTAGALSPHLVSGNSDSVVKCLGLDHCLVHTDSDNSPVLSMLFAISESHFLNAAFYAMRRFGIEDIRKLVVKTVGCKEADEWFRRHGCFVSASGHREYDAENGLSLGPELFRKKRPAKEETVVKPAQQRKREQKPKKADSAAEQPKSANVVKSKEDKPRKPKAEKGSKVTKALPAAPKKPTSPFPQKSTSQAKNKWGDPDFDPPRFSIQPRSSTLNVFSDSVLTEGPSSEDQVALDDEAIENEIDEMCAVTSGSGDADSDDDDGCSSMPGM